MILDAELENSIRAYSAQKKCRLRRRRYFFCHSRYWEGECGTGIGGEIL